MKLKESPGAQGSTDSKELDNSLSESQASLESVNIPSEIPVPRMVKCSSVEPSKTSDFLHRAVNFFRTSEGGGLNRSGSLFLPIPLRPFVSGQPLRYAYPLWTADISQCSSEKLCSPIYDLLQEALLEISPDPARSMALKQNIGYVESYLKERCSSPGSFNDFHTLVKEALDSLESRLSIEGDEGLELKRDCAALLETLPDSGQLQSFTKGSALWLFYLTLAREQESKREKLLEEIKNLSAKIDDLLAVEEGKSDGSRKESSVDASLGMGSAFINPAMLSSVLAQSSSEPMSAERRERITKIQEDLSLSGEFVSRAQVQLVVRRSTFDWDGLKPENLEMMGTTVEFTGADICTKAMTVFDDQMGDLARLFGSLRLARLEVEDQYRSELHGGFLSYFDWRSFSTEELSLCPRVVIVDDEDALCPGSTGSFSDLLVSGRQIQVILFKRHISSRSALDLAELAVSHRRAYVMQSSVAQPTDLEKGYSEGIQSALPSVFCLFFPHSISCEQFHPFVICGAASESRAHPSFSFNPRRGSMWGSRFDITQSPQMELDWPTYEFEVLDEEDQKKSMSGTFTWADFCSLDRRQNGEFMPVPSWMESDDLVSLTDYLSLSSDQLPHKLPYFWMVDQEGNMVRILVSHSMVFATQNTLDSWHRLQDLGGARSYHASVAAQKARELAEQKARAEIETLKEQHLAELEFVASEAAKGAMERLAGILLNMEDIPIASVAAVSTRPAQTLPEISVTPSQEAVAEVPQEEEIELSQEPWIETFRCTTCNECTGITPKMFQYNADKQAFIADPQAGPYEHLVLAAEKCSAKLIHPGFPLNADEPNLDALRKRAEPFL